MVAEVRETRDAGLAEYREAMASSDTPINPYRVFGDMMKVLDPYNSFVTHDSGNTRDQLSTVYDTLIPRGFLGWGNISTLGFGLAGAMAAKLAYPERQAVAVTGDAGMGYMLGNLEVPVRQQLGITIAHVANGGFAGYGPGFWGDGHDPYTHRVMGPEDVNMSPRRRGAGPVHRAGHRAVGCGAGAGAGHGGQRHRPAGLPGVHLLPVPALRRLRAEQHRPLIGVTFGRQAAEPECGWIPSEALRLLSEENETMQLTLDIDEQLLARVSKIAEARDTTVAELVVEYLTGIATSEASARLETHREVEGVD